MPRTAIKEGPDPVDVYVGAQVFKRRQELGLNQSDLGRALGLTFQQVQKYEKGTNRISASKLHKIAETLSAPVEWFFPVRGEAVAAPMVNKVEAEVITRLRRFLSTYPAEARFVSSIAAAGPFLTIGVLHVGDQGEELRALLDGPGAGKPIGIVSEATAIRPDEAQGRADHRRADQRALAQ